MNVKTARLVLMAFAMVLAAAACPQKPTTPEKLTVFHDTRATLKWNHQKGRTYQIPCTALPRTSSEKPVVFLNRANHPTGSIAIERLEFDRLYTCDVRDQMLLGVNVEYVATLNEVGNPNGQLLSDLFAMNDVGAIVGGVVPLERWLRNASYAMSARPDKQKFFREFADRCHHGKEEDLLFPALEAQGFPRDAGPTAVMRMEHEQGRAAVRGMAESLAAAAAGDRAGLEHWLHSARIYIELLRAHIQKEDHCLFGMAEEALPAAAQGSAVTKVSLP